MQKLFSTILLTMLVFHAALHSQPYTGNDFHYQGQVLESLRMNSELGDRDIGYSIYLPPGYAESNRDYPVLYLLHGYSDNETAWVQFGEVNATADRAIASREIPPMIIVMPDAGISFYINAADGSDPMEDIMIREFIPFIDKTYRTRTEREFRAVSGLSMGGYGALIWSLRNPDMFSSCAAFSAAVYTDEQIKQMPEDRFNNFIKRLYGTGENNARISNHWLEHSVINLVNTLPQEEIKKVRFYIDNGDDDFLFEGNALLHIAMRKQGIPHEFRIRDGAHNWTYWRNHIIHGLRFVGEGFHRR
ncbi:MAG: alpha/beta hydrolase [Bacteroidota bacterium]